MQRGTPETTPKGDMQSLAASAKKRVGALENAKGQKEEAPDDEIRFRNLEEEQEE